LAKMNCEADAVRIGVFRDRMEEMLTSLESVHVNGDRGRRVANTTNLAFAGAGGEALVIALDLQGISCSTGAACSSGAVEPSHVLLAIGLTADEARSSLRFSVGRATTSDEIDRAIAIIPPTVERLRALSPRTSAAAHAR